MPPAAFHYNCRRSCTDTVFPLGSLVNPTGLTEGSRWSFGAKKETTTGKLRCRWTHPGGVPDRSDSSPAIPWPAVWHPFGMRTDRPLRTGGRSPCWPPGTTDRLPAANPNGLGEDVGVAGYCQHIGQPTLMPNKLWVVTSPKGEGWGEGEQAVRLSGLSDEVASFTTALIAPSIRTRL